MKTALWKRYMWEAAGFCVGAVAGWLYWLLVGCASGSCLITSKPLNSALYGAVTMALIFNLLKRARKH